MAEHRVPMLSPALHRQPDPEHSRDPRIRALVGRLGTLEAPGPRPEFRGELRAQLVAITPRLVAEGDSPVLAKRRPSPGPAAPPEPASSPRRVRTALSRLGQVRVGRPLAVITCVVAVFAVLLGGAVWISKRALPGDALYGLKRASENVQEAMTSGDAARAKLLLDFADNRYDEVSDLLPAKPGARTVDNHTTSLVTSTLDSADGDVKSALQALGSQAIRNRSGAGLSMVTAWAGGPIAEVRGFLARIPAGTLHQRAASSLALLGAADHRAAALKALGRCDCLAHARTDDLGAVPCTKCSSAAAPAVQPPARTHSNLPTRTHSGGTAVTGGSTGTGSTGSARSSGGGAGARSSAPSTGAATSNPAQILPGGGLPTLSQLLPTGSSCPGLDLGLLSLGPCGAHLGGS